VLLRVRTNNIIVCRGRVNKRQDWGVSMRSGSGGGCLFCKACDLIYYPAEALEPRLSRNQQSPESFAPPPFSTLPSLLSPFGLSQRPPDMNSMLHTSGLVSVSSHPHFILRLKYVKNRPNLELLSSTCHPQHMLNLCGYSSRQPGLEHQKNTLAVQ